MGIHYCCCRIEINCWKNDGGRKACLINSFKGDQDRELLYGHTYSKIMDQPGKVANPARGQLNRKNEYFPVRVRA